MPQQYSEMLVDSLMDVEEDEPELQLQLEMSKLGKSDKNGFKSPKGNGETKNGKFLGKKEKKIGEYNRFSSKKSKDSKQDQQDKEGKGMPWVCGDNIGFVREFWTATAVIDYMPSRLY